MRYSTCVDLSAAEAYHQLKRRNHESIVMLLSVNGVASCCGKSLSIG